MGNFCRLCATVDRNSRKIRDLSTVTRTEILDAQERIAGSVERTPLIESELHGHKIWLKCECLQTGGAFKLRGASNRLLQLSEDERRRGVVAFSSGNHARGVAIAAKRLGVHAIIVMPSDAPAVKVEGTRGEGAEIIFYDRYRDSREEIAERISKESGATVVPSFDDRAHRGRSGNGRSGDRSNRCRSRRVGSSFHAAVADLRRASLWPVRTPRSSSSSPKDGTTCAAR